MALALHEISSNESFVIQPLPESFRRVEAQVSIKAPLDIEAERPLASDETFQRALAKATAILTMRKRQEELDKDREDWLLGLPHTD